MRISSTFDRRQRSYDRACEYCVLENNENFSSGRAITMRVHAIYSFSLSRKSAPNKSYLPTAIRSRYIARLRNLLYYLPNRTYMKYLHESIIPFAAGPRKRDDKIDIVTLVN